MRQFLQFSRSIHLNSLTYAGHSKWANIRHIKAAKDGQKSIQFAKYSRQIRLAIQEGKSTNPILNSKLQSVIDIALKNSMPNANIQNVIKKYNKSDAELKRVILEVKVLNKIYAVAVIFTDNLVFAKNQISTILRKSSAAFSDSRKVFDETGLIEAVAPATLTGDLVETATDVAIECGAEDVELIDEKERRLLFICHPQDMFGVNKRLTEKGFSIEGTDFTFIPKSTVLTTEAEKAAYQIFYDKLKAYEGIESIFDNIEPEIEGH